MSKGYASNYRIVLLSVVLFGCFGAMAARLVWLHVLSREELLESVAKTRRQEIKVPGKRGDIYDVRGLTLATNRSLRSLGVDPHALRPQDEAKWPELARMIGMSESELRTIFTTKFRATTAPSAAKGVASPAGLVFNLPKLESASEPDAEQPSAADAEVARGRSVAAADAPTDDAEVDPATGEKLRRIHWAKLRDEITEDLYNEIVKLGIRGVYGNVIYRRTYPSNQLGAHIVGFVNKAQVPGAGIESFADFYLKPQTGWRVGERDGRNRELAQFRTREVPKIDGCSVKLSLDVLVQDIIEQELGAIVEKFHPSKASIIVSDPRTGFILGIANYPSFNLNEYNKVPKVGRYEPDPMRNAAVADVYEPGSVFKIVAAAAALEERLVTPKHVFDCSLDSIMFEGKMVGLPREDHRMGNLTVSEIISHSSNKGAAQLAILVGKQKYYEYVKAFGFGRKLGFPFGGEENGILTPYTSPNWSPKDMTRIPMGHAVSATVLQMHQAMSVIANDGVLMRPQIISQITEPTGEIVYRYQPQILNKVVSLETARAVSKMLMGVVNNDDSPAKDAAIPGFDVAGKTGTTQNLIYSYDATGKRRAVGYSTKSHVGSFVGFFPAGNPQIAISVVVDEAKVTKPPFIAYGRIVAAPSFKRIGERLIPILNIQSSNRAVGSGTGMYLAHQGGRP